MDDADGPERKKAKPGPKTGVMGDYFANVGPYCKNSKRYAKQCTACHEVIPANRAKNHLLTIHLNTCPSLPDKLKKQFQAQRTLEIGAAAAVAAREEADDEEPQVSTGSAVTGSRGTTSVSRLTQNTRGAGKSQAVIQQFMDAGMPKAQANLAHKKLATWFFMGNIPFNQVESPYFLDFIQFIRPAYEPPLKMNRGEKAPSFAVGG